MKLDLRMSAKEKADLYDIGPDLHLADIHPEPTGITPMLRDTHCIVRLKGMELTRENLPRCLLPGAYYSEDDDNDFNFVRRSISRGEAAYMHRVTYHTDTHPDAKPQTTVPIVANAKLMELVEVMEDRRRKTRDMIATSALIYEEKMHRAAEDDAEHQRLFGVVCFLQDLRAHPDLLRLDISLLP